MSAEANRVVPAARADAHFDQLDGLRGVAILLVMCYHFILPHENVNGANAGWILQVLHAGWIGVDLFFVLSGFLITGILLETRRNAHYFRNFLARRFLRIWPLYYLSLVVLIIVLPRLLPGNDALQSMQDKQWWFWLYSANWLFAVEKGFQQTSGGYFWSLAVEEQFYLVWPLVVYYVSTNALLRVSIGLLAMSLIGRIVLVHNGVAPNSLYTMSFTHLDGLAVGACLAIWFRDPVAAARLLRLVPACLSASFLGLLLLWFIDGNFFYWSKNVATYGYTLLAMFFGAVLFQVMHEKRAVALSRCLRSQFMRQCGKYSYALYMVHVPVASLLYPAIFQALDKYGLNVNYEIGFLMFAFAAFAVSWLLSVASWHLFEKHILSLKRYFIYSPRAEAPSK